MAGPLGQTQVTREALELELFPLQAEEVAPEQQTFEQHYLDWRRENTGVLSVGTLRRYNQVVGHLRD